MERRESVESRILDLETGRIPYQSVTRDTVRTLRAEILLRDGLRVIRPPGLPDAKVERFLRSRRRWILRTLKRFERLAAIVPDRELRHGATVPFLGRELTLDVVKGPRRTGRLGDSIIVSHPRPTDRSIRIALERWYRAEAGTDLEARASRLAARHGLRFRKVAVRNQRTRWGSCSTRGTLSFNWRLMLAAPETVDYLVAHELAHLAEPNHSPRFWSQVGRIFPGWKEQERWLRKYGPSLTL